MEKLLCWKEVTLVLRKLLSAKRTNYAQVARRKEPLEYPENQTISYQTFMKITMDLDGIGLDTTSFKDH